MEKLEKIADNCVQQPGISGGISDGISGGITGSVRDASVSYSPADSGFVISYLAYDGSGYASHKFAFTENAFRMAWMGMPLDLRGSSAPKGSRGVEAWAYRKSEEAGKLFSSYSIHPTILNEAKRRAKAFGGITRAGHSKSVRLNRKQGSWGGARIISGRKAADMLPELREECIRQCLESMSEGAYLRYEAEWERANGRSAPKSLLAGFRRELRKRVGQ